MKCSEAAENKEEIIKADAKPESNNEDKEEAKHIDVVWRDTLEDGNIAVCNYSHDVKEME